MGNVLSYGYIPNSTKVDRGNVSPSAFTNQHRDGNRVPYHTQECGYYDYFLSNPIGVYHHPSIGTYVIDPLTTHLRGAKKCGRCEWIDAGNVPGQKKRPSPEKRREWARARYRRLNPKQPKVVRTCSEEDCPRVHYGRGLCHKHYKRLSRQMSGTASPKTQATEREETQAHGNH